MKTISEQTGFLDREKAVLEQIGDSQKKRWRLKGITLDILNRPTRNKTYYDEKMVPVAQIQESAKGGREFLYLDHTGIDQHPMDGQRFSRAACKVESITPGILPDGALEIKADLTVLDTPAGNIVAEILDVGGVIGFSKRGATEAFVSRKNEKFGDVLVPEPYKFLAFDIVPGQSVAEAETSREMAVIEQLTIKNNSKELDMITLEQVKAEPELWKKVLESAKIELQPEFEKTLKVATEQLKKELDTKMNPILEQHKTFSETLSAITEQLSKIGIVDIREASEVEKALQDKLTAAEQETKSLKDKIAAMEQEKIASAPKPLATEAVEQWFMAKPGGKAVLEHSTGKQFFTEAEMQSHYDGVSALAKAVLEISNPPAGKGEVPPADESTGKEKVDAEVEDLQKRAGITKK